MSPAFADVEPIGIEYQAPDGCPSRDEFTTQVFERTDSARLSYDVGVRTFVIQIEQGEQDVQGSLSIRESDGTPSLARNLHGSHCAEVAMALALATALAIDPQASFAPRSEEPGPPPEPPNSEPIPTFVEPIDELPPPPPADPSQTFAAIALGPAFSMGVAPALGFGGSILGEARFPGHVASIGLELSLLTVPTHETADASANRPRPSASFDLAHARPHVCVFPFPSSSALRVVPCVGTELGIIRGRGSNLDIAREQTRFWGAGTIGPRLIVDLAGSWFVDVYGNVLVPFTRYDFQFDNPESNIHDTSAVAFSLSLHFGARL